MSGIDAGLHFEDMSRLTGSAGARITPETAVLAGRAAAAAAKDEGARVCIGHSDSDGAEALAYAFGSGVCSGGGEAVYCGCCTSPALAFSVKRLSGDMGCHIFADVTAGIQLFASDGLTLFPDTEERIEELLLAPPGVTAYSHYGRTVQCTGVSEIYVSRLSEILKGKLRGIYADINSPESGVLEDMERVLAGKNDRSGERVSFHIGNGGTKLSAYSERTGYVFFDRLLMIVCRDLFSQGTDAADCPSLPAAAERLAESFGRRVVSCGRNICTREGSRSEECVRARALAAEQIFMRDGCALTLTILEIMRRRGMSLGELSAELPDYAVSSRYIPLNSPSELLRRLCGVRTDIGDSGRMASDGVLMNNLNGRVTISPVRTGKGVMLHVESFGAAMETASELCDFYEDMLLNIMRKD
ncbi:MAG: hypothetical protein ACI4KF_05800 [Huintestinicola sp.]